MGHLSRRTKKGFYSLRCKNSLFLSYEQSLSFVNYDTFCGLAHNNERFSKRVSKDVQEITHKEHYRFRRRYKWSLVKDARKFAKTIKYIAQNPVEAKIVTKVERYPYCTFGFVLGEGQTRYWLPFEEGLKASLLRETPDNKIELQRWLNSV